MMHRIKKAIDENKDKWIGIGGKFEAGESPEDCAVREISEETGLCFGPHELRFRGIVTFVSDEWGTEYMHLFTVHMTAGFLFSIPSLMKKEYWIGFLSKKLKNCLSGKVTKSFSGCLRMMYPFFLLNLNTRVIPW